MLPDSRLRVRTSTKRHRLRCYDPRHLASAVDPAGDEPPHGEPTQDNSNDPRETLPAGLFSTLRKSGMSDEDLDRLREAQWLQHPAALARHWRISPGQAWRRIAKLQARARQVLLARELFDLLQERHEVVLDPRVGRSCPVEAAALVVTGLVRSSRFDLACLTDAIARLGPELEDPGVLLCGRRCGRACLVWLGVDRGSGDLAVLLPGVPERDARGALEIALAA